jgi:Rrf2 family transcriptional regulator, cysteine metabolism repressor
MMNISTRGRYATRIMVQLARQPDLGALTKFEIAREEEITVPYVQQLLMALRLAGLVRSHRGRTGGFALVRRPEEITVSDVLRAVEGGIMPAPCLIDRHCDRADTCPTKPLWEQASLVLDQLFSGTTIADLVQGFETPGNVPVPESEALPAAD